MVDLTTHRYDGEPLSREYLETQHQHLEMLSNYPVLPGQFRPWFAWGPGRSKSSASERGTRTMGLSLQGVALK